MLINIKSSRFEASRQHVLKKRVSKCASHWKGFEMDRDEVSLRTKIKVSIWLGRKEIASATKMHKAQRCHYTFSLSKFSDR